MFGGAPPTQEFNASQNCQGVQLPPGGSCQITYSFSPGAPGTYSDMSNFTISETDSQGDGEDFSVSLTGRGGVGEVRHARSLTMGLRGDLVAKGRVSAADDFAGCEAGVTVKIQRQRQGRWRTIDTSVTDAEGLYREAIPDRSGSYRAVVGMSAMNAGQDICRRAVSPVSSN
jgi:hypothetical protein